nr:MAG TPA: hypothetical protein [Caudoviricetes sp.]
MIYFHKPIQSINSKIENNHYYSRKILSRQSMHVELVALLTRKA